VAAEQGLHGTVAAACRRTLPHLPRLNRFSCLEPLLIYSNVTQNVEVSFPCVLERVKGRKWEVVRVEFLAGGSGRRTRELYEGKPYKPDTLTVMIASEFQGIYKWPCVFLPRRKRPFSVSLLYYNRKTECHLIKTGPRRSQSQC